MKKYAKGERPWVRSLLSFSPPPLSLSSPTLSLFVSPLRFAPCWFDQTDADVDADVRVCFMDGIDSRRKRGTDGYGALSSRIGKQRVEYESQSRSTGFGVDGRWWIVDYGLRSLEVILVWWWYIIS